MGGGWKKDRDVLKKSANIIDRRLEKEVKGKVLYRHGRVYQESLAFKGKGGGGVHLDPGGIEGGTKSNRTYKLQKQ